VSSEDKPLPLVLSLVNVGADEERYLRSLLALLRTYLSRHGVSLHAWAICPTRS